MKKIYLILCLLLFYILNTNAQIRIYGEQKRGEDNNAELICEPVVLINKAEILKAEGDNNGFWIEDKNGIICSFFLENKEYEPPVIGYKLLPGKYWIYPNLKKNTDKANITLILKIIE